MLDRITANDFRAYLNQTFQIAQGETPPLEVTLASVTDLGEETTSTEAAARRRPFSLIFRGPLSPILPQQIYPVAHPEMGTLEIFLVPIGPEQGAMRYEAVFT